MTGGAPIVRVVCVKLPRPLGKLVRVFARKK